MSVTVKALNGDTSFLLTFSPPVAPLSSPGLFPGSFTALIDPWLTGPSTILHSLFSISYQKSKPCISSLKELEQEPDIILISQDKPDHCHEETLRTLPQDCQSTILAAPPAARKIRSWKYFHPELIHTLPKYVQGDSRTVHRIVVPPFSPRGTCGEVTITWMPAKRDLTGLHHAFGITYRAPCSVLSANPTHYLELPMSPPASPRSFGTIASPRTITTISSITSSPCTIVPSPNNDREKTLSVVYSPHGVPYDVIRPYASSHLVAESALPLSVLLHSFDVVENPWYLGGNISAGSPGGVQIARYLLAQTWIGAHDADKDNRGISVKQVRMRKFAIEEITRKLQEGEDTKSTRAKQYAPTKVVSLAQGQEYRIEKG